jgi:hypothetical protein
MHNFNGKEYIQSEPFSFSDEGRRNAVLALMTAVVERLGLTKGDEIVLNLFGLIYEQCDWVRPDPIVLLAAIVRAKMRDRGWRVVTASQNLTLAEVIICVSDEHNYMSLQYCCDPLDPVSEALAVLRSVREALEHGESP